MFTSDNEVGEVARRQSLELLEFVWYSRISRKSCGWWMDVHKIFGSGNYWDKEPVSYTHLTLPTIYSV